MSDGQPDFLKIEGVTKSFANLTVVDNLSMTIAKGEFVSILGPSGCGKTTTLRIIAGFFESNAGVITLDGARIDNRPSHLRGAAMVFQNYALFPHMSVFDNVAFGLRMHKVPKAQITPRVMEALELVRLQQLSDRLPRELSGGQQQRVALARAIVLRPKLLLLDEPLSNLDAKLRKELRLEFLEIHRLAKITTLLVTHDLEEAFSISDRIAVINHGKIEQYDVPLNIYTKPKTAFVSDFVGHSNVLDGTYVAGPDNETLFESKGIKLRAPSGGVIGRKARLVIPAHVLRLTSATPGGADNQVAGELKRLTYLGSTVQFVVDAAGHIMTGDMHATADAMMHREGGLVTVSWNRDDMIELQGEA